MKLYRKPFTTIFQILTYVVPILWYFPNTHEILWNVSWYSVFLLMIIRPGSELFISQIWIRQLLPYRKELGIISATVVVTAAMYRYIPMGEQFFASYSSLSYWDLTKPASYGHISEIVGFVLLITSNKYSMKKLKRWWKRIQRGAYIYFYGAAVFLMSLGKIDVFITTVIAALIGTFALLKKKGLLDKKEIVLD